jgi:hypothetical protein
MRYYNYSGNEVDPEQESEAKIGMKSDSEHFFVKQYRGMLFNPIGVDARKAKDAKWVQTTEECYELYGSFLESKKDHILRRAERKLIDV